MPRRKRSELERQATRVRPTETEEKRETKPERVEGEIRNELREAICPVCGKCISLHHRGGLQNHLDKFDHNKPFGVILDNQGGKWHGYRFIGYFNPQDDTTGLYEAVKGRLMGAVREWIDKGWITREELSSLL